MATADAGTQAITDAGTVLAGYNAGDYTVTTTILASTAGNGVIATSTANANGSGYTIVVAPEVLVYTGIANTSIYNGSAQTHAGATLTSGSLVGTNNFSLTGYAFATNVNQGAVADTLVATAQSGTVAGNYSISYVPGSLTITPLTVTATAAMIGQIYNGLTAGAGTITLTGILAADQTATTASGAFFFNNANAGLETGTVSNVTLNNPNYVLAVAPTIASAATITKAALTIMGAKSSSVFNNTQKLNTYTVTGLQSTDAITATGSGTGLHAAAYADVLAAVAGSNTSLSNYAITVINGTLTITPALLAAVVTPAAATYNGTTTITSTTALSGFIVGDSSASSITGSTTLTLSSPNAGTQTILDAGTVLVGTNASDYTVATTTLAGAVSTNGVIAPSTATTNGSGYSIVVAPEALVYTNTANTSVYNGLQQTNTGATLTSGTLFNADSFTLAGYAKATNVSQNTVADVLAATNVGSTLTSNYAITYVNGSLTITPLTITATAAMIGQTYNGSTTGAGTIVLNGVVAADQTTTAATGTFAFTSANAGLETGTVSNVTLNNPNYVLAVVPSTASAAMISPYAISITATSAVKTYDATQATPTTTSGAGTVAPSAILTSTSAPLFSGDSLSGGVYTYTDPNVAGSPTKTVTVAKVSVLKNGVDISSNFAISYVNNTTSIINYAPITISGLSATAGMIYNGGLAIGLSGTPTLTGGVAGAPVTITAGSVTSGTLAGSNAGTGIAVTPDLSGLVLSNPNYQIIGTTSAITATVSPAPLTINITAPNSVYNGSTTISGLGSTNYSVVGLVSGQAITINQSTANFNSPNVAAATTLTAMISPANATAVGTTLLSNYYLPTTATGAASITPALLTMTANTATTFIGVSPDLTSPSYTLVGLKGADTASTVIDSSAVDTNSNIYNVNTAGAGTYNAAMTLSATANPNYNLVLVPGNLVVAPAGTPVIDVANNSVVYGTYNSTNITNAGGAASGVVVSYCSDCVAGSSTHTIIKLTVAAPSSGNVWTAVDSYGNGSAYSFIINAASPAYSTGNSLKVGNYNLLASALSLTSGASNFISGYTPVYNNGVLTVTPLTLSFRSGPTMVYNGTTNINGATMTPSNAVPNDLLVVAGTGTLGSPNAGQSAYDITSALLSGLDAANYVFSDTAAGASGTGLSGSTAATVTPANITISATSAVKTFDNTLTTPTTASGTVTVAPTPIVVTGTLFLNSITGLQDTLASVVTEYSDANVKNSNGTSNKTVTVSAANILNGLTNAVSNYAIAYVANTSSVINPFQVTVSGLSAPSTNVYSGLNTVSMNGTGATLVAASGTLPTEVSIASGSVSGTVASPNVQYANGVAAGPTAQTVTPNLSALVLNSSNYVIVGAATSFTTIITPAPLTISGLSGVNKVFDTTTAATVTGTPVLTGIPSNGGAVGLSGAVTSGNFASSHVATGIVVAANLSALGLTGPNAGNYSIAGVTSSVTANITPAQVTVTGTATYNGTTTPTVTMTVAGVNGQSLSYNGTTTVVSANAGAEAVVSLSLVNGTGLASDYSVDAPAGVITILPAAITVTTANVVKTFDGVILTPVVTAGTSVAPAPVLVSGTVFTSVGDSLTSIFGFYDTIHAGSGNKTVTPTNASLYNGSINVSANYSITYVNNTTSTILPVQLLATVTPAAVMFNGGTNLASTTTITGLPSMTGTTLLSLGSPNAGAEHIINGGTTLSNFGGTALTLGDYVLSTVLAAIPAGQAGANGVALLGAPTTNGSGYTIVVAPAPLSIVGSTAPTIFNGLNQTNTYTVTGLVGGDLITASGAGAGLHVNSYADLLAAVAGINTTTHIATNLSNYAIAVTNGALIIRPALLAATVTPASKMYNSTTNLASTTALSGFVGGANAVTANTTLSTATANPGMQYIIDNGTILMGANAGDYVVATTLLVATGAAGNGVIAPVIATTDGSGYSINITQLPSVNSIPSATIAEVAVAVAASATSDVVYSLKGAAPEIEFQRIEVNEFHVSSAIPNNERDLKDDDEVKADQCLSA